MNNGYPQYQPNYGFQQQGLHNQTPYGSSQYSYSPQPPVPQQQGYPSQQQNHQQVKQLPQHQGFAPQQQTHVPQQPAYVPQQQVKQVPQGYIPQQSSVPQVPNFQQPQVQHQNSVPQVPNHQQQNSVPQVPNFQQPQVQQQNSVPQVPNFQQGRVPQQQNSVPQVPNFQPGRVPQPGNHVQHQSPHSQNNSYQYADPRNTQNGTQLPPSVCNSQLPNNPEIFRCTVAAIPETPNLVKECRLPLGITLHPFRDQKNLHVIKATIVRCRYCRAYINPYVYLPDSRHWRCNICYRSNEEQYADPTTRPEIQHNTVEFIATSDYMLRPPQPACYFFVLDVSKAAVESGYLHIFAEQFLISLDLLPGGDQTLVGFMCVDAVLHWFQFLEGEDKPRHMISQDVDDPFVPVHGGIVVKLKVFRKAIESFVQSLPGLFEDGSAEDSNCLGSALQIAFSLINEVGGRVTVMQARLPNIGAGALKVRENKDNKTQNFGPATDFYKRLALESVGKQVSYDLFAFGKSASIDLATLAEMSKVSGGTVHHFPNFHAVRNIPQVKRFEKLFNRYLTRKIGFEAVLRIRCSRGVSLHTFYASERSMNGGDLADSREGVINAAVDAFTSYNKMHRLQSGWVYSHEAMQLKHFTKYILGLLKHRTFAASPSVTITTDEQVAMMLFFRSAPIEAITLEIYPSLYPVHELTPGNKDLPSRLPLSYEAVGQGGMYLLDTGNFVYLYVTVRTNHQLIEHCFGVNGFGNIDEELTIQQRDNPYSEALFTVIRSLQSARAGYFAPVVTIREDSHRRHLFTTRLIEDRTEKSHSLIEFYHHIQREFSK
ncbi:hypothetical protein FO519_003595 [Halicephalobus sp. NKZ332]|nr:hypothetical protein FO519_003595 [Halicephalobus sp. NKZ332]